MNKLNPIFNSLLEEVEQNDHQMMERQKMSKLVALLPDDEIIMIYSFIICYSKLKNPNIGSHIIPYRGSPLKSLRGIQFHTSDIPLELQKIISLYLTKITK